MSRKHNTAHTERGTSNYPNRPGMYRMHRPPTMATLESLRVKQDRRVRATCTRGSEHNTHECNGVPWFMGTETEEVLAA